MYDDITSTKKYLWLNYGFKNHQLSSWTWKLVQNILFFYAILRFPVPRLFFCSAIECAHFGSFGDIRLDPILSVVELINRFRPYVSIARVRSDSTIIAVRGV